LTFAKGKNTLGTLRTVEIDAESFSYHLSLLTAHSPQPPFLVTLSKAKGLPCGPSATPQGNALPVTLKPKAQKLSPYVQRTIKHLYWALSKCWQETNLCLLCFSQVRSLKHSM